MRMRGPDKLSERVKGKGVIEMSAIGFLILLVLSIVLLMVLIMKIKLHPTFSLFVAALVMGLVMGVFEPEGFTFTVRDLVVSAGAGMIVAISGDILRMPGLPLHPQSENIDIINGEIEGLA